MTQTSNRFFDEVARLMNDAAGVAQGVRREFDTLFRTQAERILRDLDVVKREEFEAVKEMARLAREENEALKARIAALEAKIGQAGAECPAAARARFRPGFLVFAARHGYTAARSAAPAPLEACRGRKSDISSLNTRISSWRPFRNLRRRRVRGPARGPPGRSVALAAYRA